MKVIISNLNILGFEKIPKIIFTKGGGQWIGKQAQVGADCIGLDWQTNLNKARKEVNDQITLQGNLDPSILLSEPKVIEAAVKKVLDDYGIGEGHIFNLGHGITQFTPVENVSAMLETIRKYSKQFH